jgi:hypothetical protein
MIERTRRSVSWSSTTRMVPRVFPLGLLVVFWSIDDLRGFRVLQTIEVDSIGASLGLGEGEAVPDATLHGFDPDHAAGLLHKPALRPEDQPDDAPCDQGDGELGHQATAPDIAHGALDAGPRELCSLRGHGDGNRIADKPPPAQRG